eukprot:scaffold30856_cov36-Prasinocladus_malaysianus.AAC.1
MPNFAKSARYDSESDMRRFIISSAPHSPPESNNPKVQSFKVGLPSSYTDHTEHDLSAGELGKSATHLQTLLAKDKWIFSASKMNNKVQRQKIVKQSPQRSAKSEIRKFFLQIFRLPLSLWYVARNLVRSVRSISMNWTYYIASRPLPTLLATFSAFNMLSWIGIEVRIADSYTVVCLQAIHLVGVIPLMITIFGWRRRADQTTVLAASETGKSIGSGLVFSTTNLLDALVCGRPVSDSYLATEERLLKTAAVSCRWDLESSWVLMVRDRRGNTQPCVIHVPREQLHRALLVAMHHRIPYFWMDTISIPQIGPEDCQDMQSRKAAVLKQLVLTMTSVYASVKHVLVVETPRGMSKDEDGYARRTWTLQECVMNPRTTVIHLDGTITTLGGPPARSELSGLPPDDPILSEGLDDIQSYAW